MPRYIDANSLIHHDIEDIHGNIYDVIHASEIDNAPTADVSPVRHGRWETISDSDLSRTVICSVCNNTFYYSKRREQLKIDMMPYCPHCGAKMDEKERDEND